MKTKTLYTFLLYSVPMTSLIMCKLKPNTYTRAQDVESSAQSTDASVPCTKQSAPSCDSTSDQPHQAKSDQVYKKKQDLVNIHTQGTKTTSSSVLFYPEMLLKY